MRDFNKFVFSGRLTRDPEVKYSAGEKPLAIATFSIAVGGLNADDTSFINLKAFGGTAEFVEKHFKKGMRVGVEGRVKTGFYLKDGKNIYTTDFIVSDTAFLDSKSSDGTVKLDNKVEDKGFMSIPDGIEEELPFI